MTSGARRSVLHARVLVETTGTNETEHENTVRWAADRIRSSTSRIRNGYVATQVTTREGVNLGMSAYGPQPSAETKDIENDLFDMPAA